MANTVYTIVRTDKLTGTDDRSRVVSLRYYNSDAVAEIENGSIVKIEELEDAAKNREVYKAEDGAGADLERLVLVASPEMNYDVRMYGIEHFTNEAGTIARGYRLHHNDIFSVSVKGFKDETAPSLGDSLTIDGHKLAAAGSGTAMFKVVDINTVGRYVLYAIEVL